MEKRVYIKKDRKVKMFYQEKKTEDTNLSLIFLSSNNLLEAEL